MSAVVLPADAGPIHATVAELAADGMRRDWTGRRVCGDALGRPAGEGA